MSCFVMKKEPLAALANAVAARLNCDYNYWGFEAPASLYRELKSCAILYHCFSAGKIYCKLYTLNVQAYNGRYLGHQNSCNEEVPPNVDIDSCTVHRRPEYREHGFAVCPWHYQLAKLLDCWLYQTAEDIIHTDPLRLAIKDFRDSLYSFIIQNSPDYVTFSWGELPAPVESQGEADADG